MDNSSFGTPQPPSCATSSEALHDLSLAWITYIAISINITLCITAAFGNIVILVALQVDCHRLHSPSKLLFRSLASTDLAVGLISQPCFVMHLILIVRKRLSSCHITEGVVQISGAILCGISIFTLTAMSVDRLLALLLGLRYRQIVTPRASSWNYCHLVVGVPFFRHVVLLEHTYLHDNPLRECTAMSCSVNVLLHENLFYSALSADSDISTV